MRNTAAIADLCDVHLPVGKKRVYQMPALPIPEGRTMAEELRVQTYAGAVKRYPAHLTEGLLRDYAARSLTELGPEDAARVLGRVNGCDSATCDMDTLHSKPSLSWMFDYKGVNQATCPSLPCPKVPDCRSSPDRVSRDHGPCTTKRAVSHQKTRLDSCQSETSAASTESLPSPE